MNQTMLAPLEYLERARLLTAQEAAQFPNLDGWTRMVFAALTKIRWGVLLVMLPDGRCFRFGSEMSAPVGVIVVRHGGFAKQLLTGGGIGFAEGYLDQLWDSPDIRVLLTVIARNNDHIGGDMRGKTWFRVLQWLGHHILRRNSRSGARRNIHEHYDLGNQFYEKWLDSGMNYSSARFNHPGESLEQAQRNKYLALANSIGLSHGNTMLEIGSGWGGFAEFAAIEYGCSVTGLTISKEQFDFAKKRIFDKGLSDKVKFLMQDYRDVTGQFDRLASIEMFEAVGEKYWPAYFNTVHNSLKPGGVAGLQIITIAERHFDNYRRSRDFIQKYIFPGGMLPSVTALREQAAKANLAWTSSSAFGNDYADTLSLWFDSFNEKWPAIEQPGFDERFRRMWCYYLAYCEGGFRSNNTDVLQIALSRS